MNLILAPEGKRFVVGLACLIALIVAVMAHFEWPGTNLSDHDFSLAKNWWFYILAVLMLVSVVVNMVYSVTSEHSKGH